jgi:RNA polymerase sigma factor (sigma-70 family)
MAVGQSSPLVRHIYRIACSGADGPTDGQLLEQYVYRNNEEAFAGLVRRHGAMVHGVCSRVLGNCHDADDAYQATFLVLIRKASKLVCHDCIGGWLHLVAYRTALKARSAARRRQLIEMQAAKPSTMGGMPEAMWRELRPILDQEIARLPDKYRLPVVLCYLEGKTNSQAARLLHWPLGTVATQLARAREQLRKRLTRRGATLAAALLTASASRTAFAASTSSRVGYSTIGIATRLAASKLASGGTVSLRAAVLAKGVLGAMWMTKLRMAGWVIMATAATAGGGGVYLRGAGNGDEGGSQRVTQVVPPPAIAGKDTQKNAAEASLRNGFAQTLSGAWADKLFMNKTNYDFGTVAKGSQLKHSFPIKNIYAVPMKITGIRSSCGCVTATPSKDLLQPQEEATLDVVMDSRRFSGAKSVHVYVTVGPEYISTADLHVTANARSEVVFNPGEINFGVVSQGQQPMQTVDIEYAGLLDWRVEKVIKPADAPLNVTMEEIYRKNIGSPAGRVGYRMTVKLAPDALPGVLKHDLVLKTNDAASEVLIVGVDGNVKSPLKVAPSQVNFGSIKLGESKRLGVLVLSNRQFRVTEIKSDGNEVTAELPKESLISHKLMLRCQPQTLGELKRTVTIMTDLEESGVSLTIQANAVQ